MRQIGAARPPAGLPLRLVAIERLATVLAGNRFTPITATDLADPRDRALANRLVTTALRHQGHLNLVLVHLLERGMPKKSGSFEPVLRLALAQLLYLPDAGAHSALFLAVEALKRDPKATHLTKLLNAVLRRAQAEADTLRHAPPSLLFPATLRERWQDAYGEAAVDTFAAALLAGAPLDLTLKEADARLLAALGGEVIAFDSARIDNRERPVDGLPGYAEGRWWVQDVAASLPARLVRAASGGRVLDLCAAPGGKTAQLVKAGFAVTALDNDPVRLDRLRQNLGRLRYDAELVAADAERYQPAEPFDAVLLDAPCSATGTFRRHPEVVWHRDAADIAGRVALQRRLLASAVRYLKPGGVLVYCVCSLEPEEGEHQAAWALEAIPELLPFEIERNELGPMQGAVTAAGQVRTHPALALPGGIEGGLDGFFVARFRRR